MKQKGFAPILIVVLIAAAVGGYFWFNDSNNQTKPAQNVQTTKTPAPATKPESTSSAASPAPNGAGETANWKTYTNTKFGYQIKYPSNREYTEYNTEDYDYTSFLLGCFDILAVPQKTQKLNLPRIGRSREELKELEYLSEGQSKIYSIENWKGMQNFTYNVTYKKLPETSIDNTAWFSYEITNNYENHGNNNLYFINRNNLYLIEMISGGPCYEKEPINMLPTFKFTQ